MSDPLITITAHRRAIDDAITALGAIAARVDYEEQTRRESHASAEELAEALRETDEAITVTASLEVFSEALTALDAASRSEGEPEWSREQFGAARRALIYAMQAARRG